MRHRAIYFNQHTRKWVWECKVCPGRPRQSGFLTQAQATSNFVTEHERTPEHQKYDPGPPPPTEGE